MQPAKIAELALLKLSQAPYIVIVIMPRSPHSICICGGTNEEDATFIGSEQIEATMQ